MSAGTRIKAFAFDYLLIAGYLVVLLGVGTFLTFGPVEIGWREFMSEPAQADFVAFLLTVLPVTLYFALSEASGARATRGKRRAGIEVVGRNGERIDLARSLIRSGLKFLPWQLAHTAMFHVPGFPVSPDDPPAWNTAMLVVAWSLVAVYVVGLTRIGGGRTLYDRLAGTIVRRSDPTPPRRRPR
ncbi:MAG: RDD family protein [Gemmatimonadota bacterium]